MISEVPFCDPVADQAYWPLSCWGLTLQAPRRRHSLPLPSLSTKAGALDQPNKVGLAGPFHEQTSKSS